MNINDALSILCPLHAQAHANLGTPVLSDPNAAPQGRDLCTPPVRGTRDHVLLHIGDAQAAFSLKRSEWEQLKEALEAKVWALPVGTMTVNGRMVATFGRDL